VGIAANPESEGRVSLQVNGSFEPGKQFTVTAYVDEPLESQSLTLDLPVGLTRVDGKPTQAVPPPSEMNGSIVLWKVRVVQLGEFPIKVRSSNGVIYNTQLKIEPAAKSEIIRIEPPGAEPEKSPGPSPLPAPKPKARAELERLRTELRDAREKLLRLEVVQAEFEKRTKVAVSELKDTI